MLAKLMCLLLFNLFIHLFIYLLAAATLQRTVGGTFIFLGGRVTRGLKSLPISKDIFLRQKIIRVPPGFFLNFFFFFLTEMGPMFRPQGFC